ncbi:hypothetical protein FH969_01995 [Miniimonas arenae]|uniref:Secreted protein n=2 Tax=Miniimonas arenae TaxID=676201 RepID=A0A5C5BH76_9MICO|nr:hypothetical protein [Miniimonas arenae]TNU76883.1 hypothetical protein FH969_01995 [Miniimonas arenae]
MTRSAVPPRPGGPVGASAAAPPSGRPAQPSPQAPRGAQGQQGRQGQQRVKRRLAPSNTPSRLRLAIAVAVLASVLVGALGLTIGLQQSRLLGAVAERGQRVVALLDTRGNLVTADGTVTNAFLIGGLEPADLRATYDASLADGAAGLAALGDTPDDPEHLLAGASSDVAVYAGLVEQARANNRQGFPVGAAYLGQASRGLASGVLAPIDTVVSTTADATARDFNAVGGVVALAWLSFALLAVLVVVQIWLARRSRRVINVPTLVGTLVLLLATVVGTVVASSTASTARDTRTSSYQGSLAVSQALSLAGEARSDEAFTLIRRGSGGAYQEQFVAATEQARADLERAAEAAGDGDTDLVALLDAWVEQHAQIRALDDGGDWNGAVALATSRAEDSPSAAYDAFVTAADAQVTAFSDATDHSLRSAQWQTGVMGVVLAVAGLVSAVLCWRGIGRRLEEYR